MIYKHKGHANRPVQGLVSMAVFFLTILIHAQVIAREPAPVIDGTKVPLSVGDKRSIDERLSRIERRLDSQALIEIMSRIDQLQREMQQLVGDSEVQTLLAVG